jgi:hypothetical protein
MEYFLLYVVLAKLFPGTFKHLDRLQTTAGKRFNRGGRQICWLGVILVNWVIPVDRQGQVCACWILAE